MSKVLKTRAFALVLGSAFLLISEQHVRAGNRPANASADHTGFRNQILNGICCVPNLSSGYKATQLKNGKYKPHQDGYDMEISIQQIVFGQMDNKPVAVAVMSDWEGGSGVFMSLLLYEQQNGRAITVGSYPVGDRAQILSLGIRKGKVKLVSQQTLPGEDRNKPKTEWLKAANFDKAECIQDELSKETEKDITRLIDLYLRAFGFSNSEYKPFTSDERREALAICMRHQKDKEIFAKQFRLSLDAAGWRPGSNPLSFDKSGRPILRMDDDGSDKHPPVDLSAGE